MATGVLGHPPAATSIPLRVLTGVVLLRLFPSRQLLSAVELVARVSPWQHRAMAGAEIEQLLAAMKASAGPSPTCGWWRPGLARVR